MSLTSRLGGRVARYVPRLDHTPATIPRRRGFNVQGRFPAPGVALSKPAFEEWDFQALAEWGFDFVRLPLSYWDWGSPDDWDRFDEQRLAEIDRVVELCGRLGIHVNLCLHRIPGYCVNDRHLERADLFGDEAAGARAALDAAVHHWRTLARRYASRSNRELSFDLLNEPRCATAQTRTRPTRSGAGMSRSYAR